MTPSIFTAADIRAAVSLDDALASAGAAFRALHLRTADSPAPWHLGVPEHRGEVHVKGAHLAGAPYSAVKLSTGFPGNPALGLPASDGFSAVIEARTGRVAAMFLDGGYLTELRTGAAGALALDLLAAPVIDEFAVIGTGGQARFQIEAALRVRTPSRITIYGRNRSRAEDLAAWTRARTDADTRAEQLGTQPIRAQAIVTVTAATSPVLQAGQVAPGTHITAVGADSPGKRELAPALLHRASLVAVDSVDQSRALGELQGIGDEVQPVTLGALLTEGVPPRAAATVTIADLSGTGAQDTAIAALAASRLLQD
ncbi:hypothetical protein [Jiangella muralis]|uniref:hypothetical protein n=1 Tax=Jiangella muralis TaxID=702383 RepID=UPI00069F78C2|nr:hypothetical protein [Jiangella muralis]